MISDFRLKHGEKRVTLDATLTRIAHDQAQAMAAKTSSITMSSADSIRVSIRRAPAGPQKTSPTAMTASKTLDQWINSSGHRKNLLLPGATRVGVASVKSAKTGRTYWAMVIAGDYERQGTEELAEGFGQRFAEGFKAGELLQSQITRSAAETCRLRFSASVSETRRELQP